MVNVALCLRIDSPYPGESMSSFLGRAAQLYAMPTPTLLRELLQEQNWSSQDRRDLDLMPSKALESRLSEAVPGWQSPAASHQGFMHWTLAQRQRRAYCPKCFLEDLSEGRTPYFRNDWVPIMVTMCWKHDTPLFDWEATRSGGWRHLPKSWIYKLDRASWEIPMFMQSHLDLLAQLGMPAEPAIDMGERLSVSGVLSCLKTLQALMEKPSAAAMPPHESFRTDLGALRSSTLSLVRFAARYQNRYREPPIATAICPPDGSDWIAPIPDGASRRTWEFSDFGIRQTGDIGWRRCYLLFVARTLLGMSRFQAFFPPDHLPQLSSWRDWWRDYIQPRLGPEQQEALNSQMRVNMFYD